MLSIMPVVPNVVERAHTDMMKKQQDILALEISVAMDNGKLPKTS
jgi:hypothetical protein